MIKQMVQIATAVFVKKPGGMSCAKIELLEGGGRLSQF
jgi:hypothetical protein